MNILIDILNIAGTFLLAVEAIKIKNLIALRDNYIPNLYNIINPRIEFVDEETARSFKDEPSEIITKKRGYYRFFNLIMILLGVLLNYLLIYKFEYIQNQYERIDFYFLNAFVFITISVFTGSILWTFSIIALKGTEIILLKIESNTKNGVIGILGFSLIFIAYIVGWILGDGNLPNN